MPSCPLRIGLVFAPWLGLACTSTPATVQPENQADKPGPTQETAKPQKVSRERQLLEARLQQDPQNGGVLYVLARSAASRGQPEEALGLLERLVAIESWDYPVDVRDFESLGENPRFQKVVDTLKSRAPRVPHGPVAMELDQLDLLPEGVAWDAKRGQLLVGSMYKRQVFAADKTGKLRPVVASKAEGVLGVIGITVDQKRVLVCAAASSAPFILDFDESTNGQAGVWCFSLEDGRGAGVYMSKRTPSMFNDLVVLDDATIVVTDSLNGTVAVKRPAAEGLEEVVPVHSLLGPNGIVAAKQPGVVFVTDFDGIHRLDLGSGELTLLPVPEQVRSLGGIDGLDRQGDTLVGVQNVFSPGRIWAATLSEDGRRVLAARVLDDNHPRLFGPTTGVFVGPQKFWYLGNASLQFSPKGLQPAPAGARHVILEASLASP